MRIPRLYPILGADILCGGLAAKERTAAVCKVALALAEAGCTLLQYRAKQLTVREALGQARELRRLLPGVTLIMNDRADLCRAAGFDGVHVGQEDLSPESARAVVGADAIVGLSTHNASQLREALDKPIDYVAIGPVFSTGSKHNPDPVVGLAGVAEARRLIEQSGRAIPLVAIGGITLDNSRLDNARAVLEAGADSVAVIGALLRSPAESAREFFRLMGFR